MLPAEGALLSVFLIVGYVAAVRIAGKMGAGMPMKNNASCLNLHNVFCYLDLVPMSSIDARAMRWHNAQAMVSLLPSVFFLIIEREPRVES